MEKNIDQKKAYESVSIRLLKVVFSIYFLITLIITIFQILTEYRSAKKDVEKELYQINSSFNEAIATAVWEVDEGQLKSQLEGIVNLPIVKQVFILDENKDKLLQNMEKIGKLDNSDTEETFLKQYELIKKENGEEKLVGYLNLVSSNSVVLDRVELGFYLLILFSLVKTALLLFLFTSAFRKILFNPLTKLAEETKLLKFDDLKKITIFRKEKKENELTILENSMNSMIEDIQIAKDEVTRINKELSESLRNLFDVSEELKVVNKKLEDSNTNLKGKIEDATQELNLSLKKTEAMLLNINKAIFVMDSQGTIQSPISKYSEKLFGKKIVGENGLKLLFFHLRDNSDEKKYFLNAWKHIFGQEEAQFLSFENHFPKNVVHPDENEKKGRHLSISYAPLYDKKKKLDRLMLIVEDITKETLESLKTYKSGQYFQIMMDILPISDKEHAVNFLASYLKRCVFFLEELVGPEGSEEKYIRDTSSLEKIISKGKEKDYQELPQLQYVLSRLAKDLPTIPGGIELFSVNAITQIIESLNCHVEVFNILNKNKIGPKVVYELPKNFEASIEEKITDLDRLMVNILEYVFLVRSTDDLDKEKVSNAPKKAMLYSEYDKIIELIMKRSRLISYLLKVVGKAEKSELFYNFSELLKQMPSKSKLTEAALVNHLINPYVDIKKS